MSALHTPGPWKANQPHVITGHSGVVIAKTIDSKEGYDTKVANARLIAAAPELLAALAAITDATNNKYQFHGDKPMSVAGPAWKDCIHAARAALAKAKGGAS